MSNYLPDTALCSVVSNNNVYTYAQTETGAILELRGTLDDSTATYSYDEAHTVVRRYRSGHTNDLSPKLFTPLAVTTFAPKKWEDKTQRHLFYLDDLNRIREFISGNEDWTAGRVIDCDLRCAPYSKLAAITVVNDIYNFICLFYQHADKDAAVKTASYSGGDLKWVKNKPDLRDPPLYGTSLTAVPPRPGIQVAESGTIEARQPVLYLQLDNLKLAHAQGGEPAEMSGFELNGKPMVFSPHTSIAAVDDGSVLSIIYKSNNGAIKIIYANDGRPLMAPSKLANDKVVNPTPNGAITACYSSTKQRTIVFYQSLNQTTMKIDLWGLTLYKASKDANAQWTHNNTPEQLET